MNIETSTDALSFSVLPDTRVLIETGVSERLYLITDAPDKDIPSVADDNVLSLAPYVEDATPDEVLTARFQRAIDDVAAQPHGGTLFVPPGVYKTGTIRIKSDVTLYLAARALLQASTAPADMPNDPGTNPQPNRTQDIACRLILFEGASNAAIRGRGEIDGMGHIIRVEQFRVPNNIRVRRSSDIRIEGILSRRASGWNTHVFHSDFVTIRNVKILANWSDGIDIDNSRNVLVENTLSSSYDDAFTVKATWFDETARHVADIVLRNALLWSKKAAIKIGTETRADVMERIRVERVFVAGAREAMTIKCYDNALVRNVVYRDIGVHVATDSAHIVYFTMGDRHGMGNVDNILIDGLRADARIPSEVLGWQQGHTMSNVVFRDYYIDDNKIETAEQGRFVTNEWTFNLRIE